MRQVQVVGLVVGVGFWSSQHLVHHIRAPETGIDTIRLGGRFKYLLYGPFNTEHRKGNFVYDKQCRK